jgi:hypothetical protein
MNFLVKNNKKSKILHYFIEKTDFLFKKCINFLYSLKILTFLAFKNKIFRFFRLLERLGDFPIIDFQSRRFPYYWLSK